MGEALSMCYNGRREGFTSGFNARTVSNAINLTSAAIKSVTRMTTVTREVDFYLRRLSCEPNGKEPNQRNGKTVPSRRKIPLLSRGDLYDAVRRARVTAKQNNRLRKSSVSSRGDNNRVIRSRLREDLRVRRTSAMPEGSFRKFRTIFLRVIAY